MLNIPIDTAWQLLRQGLISDAMSIASKAYAQAPESPEVCHVLGVIACRDGRPDLALDLLQKALNGGVSERRLRDMGEALLLAKQAQAALAPVTDAIRMFGENADNQGLLAAIYTALEDFPNATAAAHKAMALNPQQASIWQPTLTFAHLMQADFTQGLPGFTFRAQTMQTGGRCPVLHFATPCDLWLKNEQGPGDTLFYLCVAPALVQRGWRLHVQTHAKMQALLESTGLFASVSLAFTCPPHGFWINIGDLPLAAAQLGITAPQAPLPLRAHNTLVEKLQKLLSKFGPPPYVAVTWRGGVQGKKIRNGMRMGDRSVEVKQLGQLLANTDARIISIQRVPDKKEAAAFERALGRPVLNLSRLNDDLPQMLALMQLVHAYVGVPNTNHHLREALGLSSMMLINRPYEDWRWMATGNSPWYPQAHCFRQSPDGCWDEAMQRLARVLQTTLAETANTAPLAIQTHSDSDDRMDILTDEAEQAAQIEAQIQAILSEGWQYLREAEVPQAIQQAQRAMALQAEHAGVFHLLGWAAMRDMKYALACSLLQKAVALAPLDGRIQGDLIRALAVTGDYAQAHRCATQALAMEDMRGRSHLHYAQAACYLRENRLTDAVASYAACLQVNPQRLDAREYSGFTRLTLGDARTGFREFTARAVAQRPELLNDWCCPVLKPAHRGSRLLIMRDMGLGDELSYLRYLPWLKAAGMEIDYWCGRKLKPLLARSGLFKQLITDDRPAPDAADYDLSFIVNEVPLATEALGAPEIAPPLPLTVNPQLVSKWQNWLASLGPGPYIGINWRAGMGVQGSVNIFDKLAKAVDAAPFAQALGHIKATFISFQRNVLAEEIQQFEHSLGHRLHDAAGLTDDLDDLLTLLSLLDENIGVSNTNMHLRAGLGLGSRVLVQYPSSDWRWGVEGPSSPWFSDSTVYRQQPDGSWQTALQQLQTDLQAKYAERNATALMQTPAQSSAHGGCPELSECILWVCPSAVRNTALTPTCDDPVLQQQILHPAHQLQSEGWRCEYLDGSMAALMGGWHGYTPRAGDIVVMANWLHPHAERLVKDARQRGAYVVSYLATPPAQSAQVLTHIQSLQTLSDCMVGAGVWAQQWQTAGVTLYPQWPNTTERTSLAAAWRTLLKQLPTQRLQAACHVKADDETTRPDKTPSSAPSRKLYWLTAGQLDNRLGYVSSVMASTRYRVLLPAANLGPKGWQSQVIEEAALAAQGWQTLTLQAGDIVIVSKSLQPAVLPHIQQAKASGAQIVVDYCDHHFDRADAIGQHQHALLKLADRVIASTPELKTVIEGLTTTPVDCIIDCFEGQKKAPRFSPAATLKLLWFGSYTNFDTLHGLFDALKPLAKSQPLHLELVTLHPHGHEAAKALCAEGLEVIYTPWSQQSLPAALERCDLVLIPTMQSEHKAGKSANRMVESLWAGRFVIAGDLPAYAPFSPYAKVGGDLIAHIQWALQHPQQVQAAILQGQQYIIAHHTPKRIGELWHTALSTLLENPQRPAQSQPIQIPTPLRLNLGCGDKLLSGYVNVDVVESRAGKRPDVLCDLHQLTPFADNSVDEILSVHVIEHFWRWEVLDILKEWVRVLKPGGQMILECPNLQSACEAFLQNPEVAMSEGMEGQRSMWVFYGDPAWKDPYMVHRWGYTPASLAKLMTQAGLVNARQAPAQFKLREPRDMRVVAEKPLL